ncbi:hypothetical protein BDZ97DRAFT_1656283 [Flammula alnicola]|nr:hypothetical protein BDZ97DRAFT_1683152 [Flammula alnicola]KAF8967559.1 hypothetical protein BDZ97DRAFT_1656283 [Flammula alnicola]
MILTCYYCNKDLPSNQMKRCSRCLLVTYCSKECQAISWKASHKQNCKIHPSIASPTDPDKPVSKAERPKKSTPEWVDLEMDRALSRWLQLWRSCFRSWTIIALDLANHPPERVMTHCMQLIVQPHNIEGDPAKRYHVVQASVVSISDVQAVWPELHVSIDPTDFRCLRFVVILQDDNGEARRLRLVHWNDLNVDQWRKIDKASSASLGGPESGWAQALMDAVASRSPKEVEEMLGKNRA